MQKGFLERALADARVRAYLQIVLGCVVGAAAYPMFLTPNKIAPGGLTGIATILNYLFSAPIGLTSLLLNLPLFIVGYRTMGRVFVFRSLIATVIFSVLIDLLPCTAVTDDILLGSVYGGILLGVGLGLILRGGATTGGSDMIARMVHRKFPYITVGVFLFAVDCAVIMAAWFTMSALYALYALICIFVSARVVDLVLDGGMGSDKACFVVSANAEQIAARILTDLERGATLLNGKGAYSGKALSVILCVVGRAELPKIKALIHEEDKSAFLFVTNAHETLGEGFGEFKIES